MKDLIDLHKKTPLNKNHVNSEIQLQNQYSFIQCFLFFIDKNTRMQNFIDQ